MENTRLIAKYRDIIDAYDVVKQYARIGMLEQLKAYWRAHPNLTISQSDEPVRIARSAMDNYIKDVHEATLRTHLEQGLLFACSTDGKEIMVIEQRLTGDGISVDVVAQRLYEEGPTDTLIEIKTGGMPSTKAGFGHTHPSGFGPVFSYASLGPRITPYGRDYSIAISTRGDRQGWLDAPYHLMGAPSMNLFGVIEALPDGIIVYHPWKVDERIDSERATTEGVLKRMASRVPIRIKPRNRKRVRVI